MTFVRVEQQSTDNPALFAKAVSLLALFCLVAVLGDGWMGGNGDDERYLWIAQQWLAHGPTLPTNHWEGRWPLNLPLAASIGLFGLHRWSVALPSFVAAAVSLVLVKRLGDRHFGEPVGIFAATILAILPFFAREATDAAVEPIELAFILAAFYLLGKPFLAGLMLGLACQARETAAAALPILLLLSGDWRNAARMLGGFAIPFAIEGIAFFAMIGDPLFRRQLALAHTALPTPVLPTREAHPLFNTTIIRSWHREAGIHVHWTIDGYLNLLANPTAAFLPALTLVQFLRDRDRRGAFLLGAAVIYSAALIYALAVFPAPRMFTPSFVALALVFATIAVRRWDGVSIACSAVIVLLSLFSSLAHPSTAHWQRVAERWVSERPGQIATKQQSYWVFSPTLQQLPKAGRPYVLTMGNMPCGKDAIAEDSGGIVPKAIGYHGHLCLYRAHENKDERLIIRDGSEKLAVVRGDR